MEAPSTLRHQNVTWLHLENTLVKYGIKGTFYYPKSSKKYTVFEPWNSMKNEIQGKKLGMSTMKRQLFTTC